MDHKIELYQSLEKEFSQRGYLLYLVGGTVRDYLLNKELTDMDLVTDATPSEMKEFILGDYTFERFGSVKVKKETTKFDITTLRKESGYIDNRHPNKIIFTKDIKEDVCRRDITINALYMDKDLKVIDLVDGKSVNCWDVAHNDGLNFTDWRNWFKNYDHTKPMAIIHFTKFRY